MPPLRAKKVGGPWPPLTSRVRCLWNGDQNNSDNWQSDNSRYVDCSVDLFQCFSLGGSTRGMLIARYKCVQYYCLYDALVSGHIVAKEHSGPNYLLLCFSGSSIRGSNSSEDHLTTHTDTYRGQFPSCPNPTTHTVRLQQLRTTSIPLGKCAS